MIRFPVPALSLEDRIEAEHSGWLANAATRTAGFRAAGRFDEEKHSWSQIKRVYMRLQHNKCAYCERCLSDGPIEHDVEHYRPKNAVPAWPTADDELTYSFKTGDPLPNGYYLLSYHPWNYVTACKSCNTNLKINYFPVARKRVAAGAHPTDYSAEMPFLPYPLGVLDDDPETLLTFRGVEPRPHPKATAAQKRRAQITIDFFRLDSREDLRRERAFVIVSLETFHGLLICSDARGKANARRDIDNALSADAPHTNCARSFHRLYLDKPKIAQGIADKARAYLEELRARRGVV